MSLSPKTIPLEQLNIKVAIGTLVFDMLLDKAFHAEGRPLKDTLMHKHPAYEMHYITKGSAVCVMSGMEIPLEAGNIILIPPGKFHCFRHSNQCARGYLQFTYHHKESQEEILLPSESAELLTALTTIQDYAIIHTSNTIQWIQWIQKELEEYKLGCYAKIQGLFTQLLIDLLRSVSVSAHIPESDDQRIPLKTKNESRTRIIDLFFEKMINEQLRIEQLAEELHLSIKQTQRVIGQLYGKSFKQIAIETHIEIAKELLRTSSLTILQIADRLGYEESRHFSRRFTQETGMTPNEYRQQYST